MQIIQECYLMKFMLIKKIGSNVNNDNIIEVLSIDIGDPY